MRIILAAIVVSVLSGAAALAATTKPLSFVCQFPSQRMSLTFVVSEQEAQVVARDGVGTALLVGNQGTERVMMFLGSAALSFVETLATGAVQTTTIQTESLKAVHSRHTLMGFGPDAKFIPSQALGTCERRL